MLLLIIYGNQKSSIYILLYFTKKYIISHISRNAGDPINNYKITREQLLI